jgi:hypothetical protein
MTCRKLDSHVRTGSQHLKSLSVPREQPPCTYLSILKPWIGPFASARYDTVLFKINDNSLESDFLVHSGPRSWR